MNLFILSENPEESAKYHVDKHVTKMPVEVYQMMGSALIRRGVSSKEMPTTKAGTPLKGGYPNHPCTRWVGDSMDNFIWAATYGFHLCMEYRERYKKIHFVETKILEMLRFSKSGIFPDIGLTDFAIAISDDSECRKIPNFDSLSAVDKYRYYYIMDKKHIAKWTNTEKPNWYKL